MADVSTAIVHPVARTTPGPQALTVADRIDQQVFDAIYSRSLVYNTCWEDPAVDRRALCLTGDDTVLVITSGGCNALDYAIERPARIDAVDANPRQTALLELKLAGIRRLSFEDFFALFGRGRHDGFRALYRSCLRPDLSPFARRFWDARQHWFLHHRRNGSFYDFGLSGIMARLFRNLLHLRPQVRNGLDALLEARTLEDQRDVYARQLGPAMWTPAVNWMLGRQLTMSMLGVPHPQRKEVERQHRDGIGGFVRESIEYVVQQLPIWQNYFWTLYLRGYYTPGNCPRYLTPDGFATLRNGAVERLHVHTCTVLDFLRQTPTRVSKFVLLDHMDWMSSYHPQALVDEWNAILERAAPGARVLLRSAHAAPAYLQTVRVGTGPGARWLSDAVRFNPELAAELSAADRVHTYAGFHIADIR